MGLIEKMARIGLEEDGPTVAHGVFHAALYELAKGFQTRQHIIDYFNLSGDDITDLDWIISKYNAQENATAKASFVEQIGVIFQLAEVKAPGYTTRADLAARVNAI